MEKIMKKKRTSEIVRELDTQGKSKKEIARIAGITVSDVSYHLRNKRKKKEDISEKRMIVRKLKAEGKSQKEIAEETGYNLSTVRYYFYSADVSKPTAANADRHLCRTCKWRDEQNGSIWCDYYWQTKKDRPCEAENCTVYEKET